MQDSMEQLNQKLLAAVDDILLGFYRVNEFECSVHIEHIRQLGNIRAEIREAKNMQDVEAFRKAARIPEPIKQAPHRYRGDEKFYCEICGHSLSHPIHCSLGVND